MRQQEAIKTTIFISILTILLVGSTAHADAGRLYQVTFTNITRGQVITPPVLISHNRDFRLFKLGSAARAELVMLAEDGHTGPLEAYLDTLSSVLDVAVGGGPLLPGESMTLNILAQGNYQYFTAVGMLASSNDAFFGIQGVRYNPAGVRVDFAPAYDAGSETNSESCSEIPGPPCGSADIRNTMEAEGYVHIHAGIHGTGDLVAAEFDWHNPVIEIQTRPIPATVK